MDFNGHLLAAMLIRGRFDTRTVHESQFRIYANHVLAFIQFFCSIKMLVVLVMPWNDEAPILFYLIDYYVFPGEVQKSLFIAVCGIHMHIAYIYWKWNHLSADPRRLHYLKMFFMPDIGQLCRYYNLPLNMTKKFLRKIKILERMTITFIVGFELSFILVVGRCLYFSHLTIPTSHFYLVAVPMYVITTFGYHWLASGFLVSNLLALSTISFLELRMSVICQRLRRKFSPQVTKYAHERYPQIVLLKNKKDLIAIMRTINDIVNMYKETNQIFDRLISPTYVSCLMGALIYPTFIFLDIPYMFKWFVIVLYILTIGVNCFIITIFNEGFIRHVSHSVNLISKIAKQLVPP